MIKKLFFLATLCVTAHCAYAAEKKEESKALAVVGYKLPELLPLTEGQLKDWRQWPEANVHLNVKAIAENALCYYRYFQTTAAQKLSSGRPLSIYKEDDAKLLPECGQEVMPYSQQLLQIPLPPKASVDERTAIREYTIKFPKDSSWLLYKVTKERLAHLKLETKTMDGKPAMFCTLEKIDTLDPYGARNYIALLLRDGQRPKYQINSYATA